jgi:predicted nucleic acid-binding protein
MTTFVDTNVLVYLLEPKSKFHEWAKKTVAAQREKGPLVICDIVYSELSVDLASVEATDKAIGALYVDRLRFSNEELFEAGKAYQKHITRGGSRNNVLSDFLIAAQAVVHDAPLLTNNPKDVLSYFPKISVIAPP